MQQIEIMAFPKYSLAKVYSTIQTCSTLNEAQSKLEISSNLLDKPAAETGVRGISERRTRSYTSVLEDSSTESTKQSASGVALGNKSTALQLWLDQLGFTFEALKDKTEEQLKYEFGDFF